MKTLKIQQDLDPMSPRDDSNMGTIAYKSNRYILGEEYIQEDPIDFLIDLYGISYARVNRMAADMDCFTYSHTMLKTLEGMAEEFGYVLLPVYIYDHSGITLSTTPFQCRWDSGQVGFIYATLESVNQFGHGWKRWSKKRKTLVEGWLEDEINTMSGYVSGEVYGFIIEEDGQEIDSCWGFYGSDPRNNGMEECLEGKLEDYEIIFE